MPVDDSRVNDPCAGRVRIVGGVTDLLARFGEWGIRLAVVGGGGGGEGGGGRGFPVCTSVAAGGMTPLISLGGTLAGFSTGSSVGGGD